MNMFEFFEMKVNYEERKVDNTIIPSVDAVIDTCAVNDSTQPYETAIKCSHYNNGEWVVVEQYDSKEEAQKGHERWVQVFKSSLPTKLIDVSECHIASELTALEGKREYLLNTSN